MSERRYSDEEVAAIFQRAAEAAESVRPPSSGEGLTLAEVQEIGRDVGIPPELIARAAGALDRAESTGTRKFLGLPIGVRRTVELDRPLSDGEWEALVGRLRETFEARGRVRYDGPFREWTNGNLHVLVEPTGAGHRIRMQTVKGNARALMTVGLGAVGMAGVVLIAAAIAGQLGAAGSLTDAAFLATIGVGLFGVGALQLPGWARRRLGQMERLAERLVASRPAAAGLGRESADPGALPSGHSASGPDPVHPGEQE